MSGSGTRVLVFAASLAIVAWISCTATQAQQSASPSVSFDPLPSLPGVTYAGWARVENVAIGTLRVTPTMGSPSQLFVGRTVDLRTEGDAGVSRNDCIYVEFVADAEADGRHRLVTLSRRQAPDPVRCTG